MGIPTIVSTMDVSQCADHCRNNSEPTSGAFRLCQGFNYQDISTPTCEFFDNEAQIGPLNRNVGVRSFYFEKICLNGNFCVYSITSIPLFSGYYFSFSKTFLSVLKVKRIFTLMSFAVSPPIYIIHKLNFTKYLGKAVNYREIFARHESHVTIYSKKN